MPRRIEVQQAAIESWLDLGFDVVSVNIPGEVEHLHTEFPGITFLHVSRSAASGGNDPHVYLSELFNVLTSMPGEICGVVNSDISLLYEPGLYALICNHAEKALVLGSRIDLSPADSSSAMENSYGFDVFFFHRKILDDFPSGNFCLGMPWWDFWFPLMATACGVPLKRLMTPVAHHVIHEVAWGDAELEKFWLLLSRSWTDAAAAQGGAAGNSRDFTYAFAHDMTRGAEILRHHLQFATESLFLPHFGHLSNTVTFNEAAFLAMKAKLVAYEERLAERERLLAAAYASNSWRLTGPLRLLKSKIKCLVKQFRFSDGKPG